MTTALMERPAEIAPAELELVKRTVASGATDAELRLFLFDCQRRGVHPLDKLLHFTKRGGKYTPVTSIDFMRSQAAGSGEMAGSDDPVFVEFDADRPESATVTVYRLTQGQRFAYTATARWSEYCPDNAPMWRRMPHTMLGKCAEALALRKAFPQQLAGLYSREEMDQADTPAPPIYSVTPPPEPPEKEPARRLIPPFDTTKHGEEIPADGRLYIAQVDKNATKNKNVTKYLVTFSDGSQASTIKDHLAAVCEQLCQDRAPVRIECEDSKFGKNLTAIHRDDSDVNDDPASMAVVGLDEHGLPVDPPF